NPLRTEIAVRRLGVCLGYRKSAEWRENLTMNSVTSNAMRGNVSWNLYVAVVT
ncbi:hypothetical protein NPIL_99591, partial [Nephila pilipes]